MIVAWIWNVGDVATWYLLSKHAQLKKKHCKWDGKAKINLARFTRWKAGDVSGLMLHRTRNAVVRWRHPSRWDATRPSQSAKIEHVESLRNLAMYHSNILEVSTSTPWSYWSMESQRIFPQKPSKILRLLSAQSSEGDMPRWQDLGPGHGTWKPSSWSAENVWKSSC